MSSGPARGLAWGLLGVAAFSLTLPATRMAVSALDPWFVALGRAFVAALVAAMVLALTRTRFPTRDEWVLLALSAIGVVFGFPLFTTWAMTRVPANHGAVILAILPLATAAAGAIVARERPSAGFWIAAVAGTAVVLAFALYQSDGALRYADAALLAAVVCAAFGYAFGARAARTLGSWQAISWSLVLCLPLLLPAIIFVTPPHFVAIPAHAWVGFLYVALVSQYLGFFAWYRGLALDGIARIGQLQLLQPFLTLLASALILEERIGMATVAFAGVVVAIVAAGRSMPIAVAREPESRRTRG